MLNAGELYREQGPSIVSERDAENAAGAPSDNSNRLGHKITLQPLPEPPDPNPQRSFSEQEPR